MLPTTQQAISAMLRADPSLDAQTRLAIIAAIRNHGKSTERTAENKPRLLKRREVADRLGVCTRTVDGLARSGALRRVLLPHRQRGAGFIEADVMRLIENESGGV